jgi:ribonuclease Z
LGLGLKPGPDFTRLQSGETINGVRPEQIIGKSRPGCSVAYTGDTIPCSSVSKAVKGVDVLIHESTFSKKESKLALEHMHSTAEQAAITAKESGAKTLLLVHISNRYDDITVIENEAKEIFNDSIAVKDMQMFHVTNGSIRSI